MLSIAVLSIAVLSIVGLAFWAHSVFTVLANSVLSVLELHTLSHSKGRIKTTLKGKKPDQGYKEAREPAVSFLPFSTFFVGTVRSKSIKRNFYIQPLPPFLPGTAEQSCAGRQMIDCLVAVLTCRSQFPRSHKNGICCHSRHNVLSLYHQYRWI